MRLSATGILLLAILLTPTSPTLAQTEDPDTRPYSEQGWVLGVAVYGSYTPVVSADLDRVFADQGDFAEYQVPSLAYSTRIILGWPDMQIGFDFEATSPTNEEIESASGAVRRVQSQKSRFEVSLGYPLRLGKATFSMTPALGFGASTIEVDMTETSSENSLLTDEQTVILFAQRGLSGYLHPHLTLDLKLSPFFSLQAIGGASVPILNSWKTSTGEPVEPGADLGTAPTLRLGVMMNLVDFLHRE